MSPVLAKVRPWLRRTCAALIGGTFLAIATSLGAPTAQAADLSKIGRHALERLSQCIQTSPNLEVLLVIDESASLKQNDSKNVRSEVLPAFVELLGELSAVPLEENPRHIELAVSSFAVAYREWVPWSRLDGRSAARIAAQLRRGLPSRNEGLGTDYLTALRGARQTLRAGANRFSNSQRPCKLMMWFTDGILDVGTDKQNAEARAKLCAKSGPVSGLRKDGVITVAVLLIDRDRVAAAPKEQRRRFTRGAADLRAAAESQSGKTRCGTVTADRASGVYLEGDVSALARLILIIINTANGGGFKDPADPEHLLVEPGVAYFTVAAEAPRGLTLRSPDGSTLTLDRGGPSATSGTIEAKVRWIGATAYLTVPVAASGVGEWQLRRDSESPIAFFLYADLDLALDDADLVAGEVSSVRGTVRRGDGSALNLADFATVDVALRQKGSPSTAVVPVKLNKAERTFAGDFTPAEDVTSVRFVATLEARTQHGMIFRVARASVQPVTRLDYPKIEPVSLPLGSVRKPRETAAGSLKVTGAQQGPSTVCLVAIRPASGSDLSTLAITPAEKACKELAPGQQVDIPVQASLTRATADGLEVSGVIELSRTRASSPIVGRAVEQTVEVPFSVQILPVKISPWLFAAIFASGFLLPFLLMYIVQLLARRLLVHGLMRARVPVTLVPGASPGHLVRTEPAGEPLIGPRDLEYPEWGDARTATVVMPSGETLRARLSPNPFASPYGEVAAPSGSIVLSDATSRRSRSGRRSRIPLRPDKEVYLLVARSELGRTKADEAVAGTLVALVAPVPGIDAAATNARLAGEQRAGAWAEALGEMREAAKASDPNDRPAPAGLPDSWGGTGSRPDIVQPPMGITKSDDWGNPPPGLPVEKQVERPERTGKGRKPKPRHSESDQRNTENPKDW